MKIYTKGGDAGQTSLFGGVRVDKDDAQVVAYGSVDELNALLGLALAADVPPAYADLLRDIQGDLFVVGAELATAEGKHDKLRLPLISDVQIEALERTIDEMEQQLSPLKTFVLPGGGQAAAALHVARTVCRRAERDFVRLSKRPPAPRQQLGVYLNRLSDFLFVLARYCNHQSKIADIPWQP